MIANDLSRTPSKNQHTPGPIRTPAKHASASGGALGSSAAHRKTGGSTGLVVPQITRDELLDMQLSEMHTTVGMLHQGLARVHKAIAEREEEKEPDAEKGAKGNKD